MAEEMSDNALFFKSGSRSMPPWKRLILEEEFMNFIRKISFLICCILPLFFTGCKPAVTITSPANGDTFAIGEEIIFEGEATDQQYPDLSDDVFVWTSDKDGEIGAGPSFESSDLSEGKHTITLTVRNPHLQSGRSTISITVGNGDGSTSTTTIIETTPNTTTTIEGVGERFKDNYNGTVTDARTGLIWLKNANSYVTYDYYDLGADLNEAIEYCSNLASRQAGLTDGSVAGQWRLPTLEELEGIGTDPPTTWDKFVPSVTWTMPGVPFINVQPNTYWSSTTYVYNTDYAAVVLMNYGYVGYGNKSYEHCVWPVRSGQ